ncbi:MAG: hypothetical protein AAFN94_14185, partial [Pseudomonadota bacterium]
MTTQRAPVVTDFATLARLKSMQQTVDGWHHEVSVGEIVAVGPTTLRAEFARLGLGSICKLVTGKAAGTLTESVAKRPSSAITSVRV